MELIAFETRRQHVDVQLEMAQSDTRTFADRVEIQQVLLNVLRNACEALAASEAPRVIRIRSSIESSTDDQPCLAISVSDNGPGVSEDRLDKIFDAFYTTKTEGMGLGLAISRTIVRSYGGEMSARRSADGGLEVGIQLKVFQGDVEND